MEIPVLEEIIAVVDAISFKVYEKTKIAVLGESGSGKSILSMAISRLLPVGAQVKGRIIFDGKDLLNLPEQQLEGIRGKDLLLIPQIPLTCLDPCLNIESQLSKVMDDYKDEDHKKDKIIKILKQVGLSNPLEFIYKYPHEISGSIAQRIIMAMSLAVGGNPQLVIADEPTRGMNDINTRQQFMEMFCKLYKDSAWLMITHDLEMASLCELILIISAGEIVEYGPRERVLKYPLHPYTKKILESYPKYGMMTIPGVIPGRVFEINQGCRFYSRCDQAADKCKYEHPPLKEVNGVKVRCFCPRM